MCSILFGGCNEVTLTDKYFTDKEVCEELADKMADVLIVQMEEQGILGELHYGCVEDKKDTKRI
jgi:hypothetical protein